MDINSLAQSLVKRGVVNLLSILNCIQRLSYHQITDEELDFIKGLAEDEKNVLGRMFIEFGKKDAANKREKEKERLQRQSEVAKELLEQVELGSFIWVRGTRDGHGIRKIISKVGNEIVCEQIHLGFNLRGKKPQSIRDDFEAGKINPQRDYPLTITSHMANKLGGIFKRK